MSSRRVPRAALTGLAALSLLTPTQAHAEPTPSPSPTSTLSPLEQYRIDRENYLDAVKGRSIAMKNINIAFKEAFDKAAREFKLAMASARTPDQKTLAANTRKSAITTAIAARDAAIAALGAEPVPPVEPAKPMKISSKKKGR